MEFDSAQGDVKAAGDLCVGETCRHQAEYLELALAKRINQTIWIGSLNLNAVLVLEGFQQSCGIRAGCSVSPQQAFGNFAFIKVQAHVALWLAIG